MGWKNWSTWLKGLIWGIVFAIIFSALIGLSVFLPGDAKFGYQFLLIPPVAIGSILVGLIIGIIVGIVRKIKSN